VPYAGRYLIVKENDKGEEDEENGTVRRYCVKCSREKGYVDSREEKGESILTFFEKTDKLLEISAEGEEKEVKAEAAEETEEKEGKEEKEEEPEEDTNE